MKKTITINLSNVVFTIDDNAYDLLSEYLANIAARFASDSEKDDIMNDIEARIAELLSERLDKTKMVIVLSDVEDVMKIMGDPKQFSDGDETETDQESSGEKEKTQKKTKRFYRDPENTILGGIGGGLAAYLKMDVTLVRALLVVLFVVFSFFGSGWIIFLGYILLWIIAPKAVTVSQRLEMQGEDVTIDNIKAEFDNLKNYVESEKFRESTRTIGEKIGAFFATIFKIIGGFFAAIFSFVGFIIVAALIIALISVVLGLTTVSVFFPSLLFDLGLLTQESSLLLLIALLLIVGCPLFLLIHWLVHQNSSKKNKSKSTFWVVLLLWIAGIFMFLSVGANVFVTNKNAWDWEYPLHSSANDTTTTIDFLPFNAIELTGNIRLVLLQDSLFHRVEITSPENYLSYIKTELRNGKLHLSTDDKYLPKNIELTVYMDEIREVSVFGATTIKTPDRILVDDLLIELSGATKGDFNLIASGTVDTQIKGASALVLEGIADSFKVDAKGTSNIDAEKLKALHAFILLQGASKASVYASESASITAKGTSYIECFGSPKKVEQSTSFGSSVKIR